MTSAIVNKAVELAALISALPDDASKIDALNEVRSMLHHISPMRMEPIDLVLWVRTEDVQANAYNPNSVAPPEMKLLEISIAEDGYTQPVVTWCDGTQRETVDGYHRGVVGRTSLRVRKRTRGYLPVSTVNADRTEVSNRMASTIRHNRARGVHSIELMKDIVAELVASGMSDQWISRHIGMDADELLRLKQISGLAALFKDREFSKSWQGEADDHDA